MLMSERSRRAEEVRTTVVALNRAGLTHKEIGQRLGLTFNQVKNHIQYDRLLTKKAEK